MYTIEEHRFVWYHRHFLLLDSHQTYGCFQKEFKLPTVTRANLDQLATRLDRQRDPNVVARIHNESWAVRKVVPKVVPVYVRRVSFLLLAPTKILTCYITGQVT